MNNETTNRNLASPINLWTAVVEKKGPICDCCGRKVKKVVHTVCVSLETGRYVAHGSLPLSAVQVRPVGPECVAKYRADEVA